MAQLSHELRRWIAGPAVALGLLAAALPAAAEGRLDVRPAAGIPGSVHHPVQRMASPPGMRASSVWRARPRTAVFSSEHLQPKMSSQLRLSTVPELSLVATFDPMRVVDTPVDGRRAVERGFRKAVKSYLIEETTLGRLLGLHRHGGPSASPGAAAEAPARVGPSFDVGFVGGAPALLMKNRMARGTLRMRLNAQGELGIDYLPSRLRGGPRFAAKADPTDHRFEFSCLISF